MMAIPEMAANSSPAHEPQLGAQEKYVDEKYVYEAK